MKSQNNCFYVSILNLLNRKTFKNFRQAREDYLREKDPNKIKYGPEITLYLDTFHAVSNTELKWYIN